MNDLELEERTSVTTAINPGAYNPPPKVSIRSLFAGTFNFLRRKEIQTAINYFVGHGLNYINQYKSKDAYLCNICNTPSPYFYHNSNKLRIKFNSICPKCNSRPRHRGLYSLYKEFITENSRILHFAPEPILSKYLKSISSQYYTTDYFLKDVDYPNEDIQNLTFDPASFDYVLCNHVIEHVPNDDQALSEISRILKPTGLAIITVPGKFKRQETIYFKDLKLNGHYRDYGLDFADKAELFFSKVEMIDLATYDTLEYSMGISPKEDIAFLCYK